VAHIDWLLLAGGLVTGLLSGLLGIGGGIVMVPLLLAHGVSYHDAVATSSFAIVLISWFGTIQNFRRGSIQTKDVLVMGAAGLGTAALGAALVPLIEKAWLELAFAALLFLALYLNQVEERLLEHPPTQPPAGAARPYLLLIGGCGGFLAGLFGVGGGVIMVPLQLLFLNRGIKEAVRNSLGVVAISSLAASVNHGLAHSILYQQGLVLGGTGILGAQLSLHVLPRLPDRIVRLAFGCLMVGIAGNFLRLAWVDW